MYRVKPDGSIECDRPEEAVRLSRMLARNGAKAEPESGHRGKRTSGNGEYKGKGLAFLKCIKEPGNGTRGDAVAKAIHLSNPRGIGPILGYLKRTLKGNEIDIKDVVERRRQGNDRLWYPGRRISEAIELLE